MIQSDLYKKLFESKKGIIFFAIAIFLYLSTISFTCPRTDDDYIGEQVYWLTKLGYVKSELMRGYGNIGLENLQTVYHKLFIYQGAIFASLFGWSLPVLHLVSLFYTAIFLILLFIFLKSGFENYKGMFLFIAAGMLLHHDFSFYSCAYRPEVMLMTLGFASYIFLDKFLLEEKKKYLFLAGALAGLSFLTHLNGLIFMVSGFLLLVINKKYLDSIIFGFTGTVFFAFYFLDIFMYSSFDFFWMQFSNDPSIHKSNFSFFSPLLKLIDEPMRFFHSQNEVFFSIPLLLILIFQFNKIKLRHRNLLIYSIILVVTLSIYTYSKTTKYIIIYMPFLMILLAIGWQYIEEERSRWKKIMVRISIIIYFVFGLSLSAYRGYNNIFYTGNIAEENMEKSHYLKGDSINVLANGSYIFDQIKSNKRIMNIERFIFFIESHDLPKMNFNQLLDSANYYNMDYIILNPSHVEYFNVGQTGDSSENRYSIITPNGSGMILKLNEKSK